MLTSRRIQWDRFGLDNGMRETKSSYDNRTWRNCGTCVGQRRVDVRDRFWRRGKWRGMLGRKGTERLGSGRERDWMGE
jgi:hypothetical protein